MTRDFVERSEGGFGGLLHRSLDQVAIERLFDDGRPLDHSGGRGAVHVLDITTAEGPIEAVARDYRRGGAFRSVSGRRFAGPGRAISEVESTLRLAEAGVPTLAVLGAVWRSDRLGRHRLRFLTRLESGIESLARAFDHAETFAPDGSRRTGERLLAEAVAGSLRLAFDAGLQHRDLHPENLMVRSTENGPEVLVIDLDRCGWSPGRVPDASRDAMLVRLSRYCIKHRHRFGMVPAPETVLTFLEKLDAREDPIAWSRTLAGCLADQCRRRRRRFGLSRSDLERIESYPMGEG